MSLDIAKYMVFVLEDETEYHIVLSDPKQTELHKGSGPDLIGFEVSIAKASMRVTRSKFTR